MPPESGLPRISNAAGVEAAIAVDEGADLDLRHFQAAVPQLQIRDYQPRDPGDKSPRERAA